MLASFFIAAFATAVGVSVTVARAVDKRGSNGKRRLGQYSTSRMKMTMTRSLVQSLAFAVMPSLSS